MRNKKGQFEKGNKPEKPFAKGNIPWNKGLKSEYSGKNHYMWKGDKAGYFAKHAWIQNKYGKASKCENCGVVNEKRYHWSNIDHKYRRNIKDWRQLCASCHKKHDVGMKEISVRKLAIDNNISPTTLFYRLKRGVPIEDALKLKPQSGKYWNKMYENIK